MTLHFQTKDLRDAVQQLQPVLSSKQTLPVLGAVAAVADRERYHYEARSRNQRDWNAAVESRRWRPYDGRNE